MARLPRLTLPQYPHHVIQRGNNRQVVFTDAEDFEKFWRCWQSIRSKPGAGACLRGHAQPFSSLVTPASEEGLPKMMQSVGRAYAQYFNKRHQRTGTLWEGRYRATVLEAQTYLLPCMAFIDSTPCVRAWWPKRQITRGLALPIGWSLRHDRMLSRTQPTGLWATPVCPRGSLCFHAPRGSITASGALAGGCCAERLGARQSGVCAGLCSNKPLGASSSPSLAGHARLPSKTEGFLCMPFWCVLMCPQ